MIEKIADLIIDTAMQELVPRFRALAAHEIEEKGPGDLVTVADRAAETRLTAGLLALVPGCTVVGEEAAHGDSALLDKVGAAGPVFVVDPLDGTANFAAGRPEFAVMVARLERGRPTAAWIYDPLGKQMLQAQAGGGTFLNGERIRLGAAPVLAQARGVARTRFLDDPWRSRLEAQRGAFVDVGSTLCAGHDYLRLLTGAVDFLLYWRTLPWDHAPGALLVAEAGGISRRPDGRAFICDRASRGFFRLSTRPCGGACARPCCPT
ncbi:inositol monophosphatase family protein [Oleomonas cavernae]|uniref:inositol monophosphatase family protein n=1 Tax=Oleomonas cavernae TaxID=2320859 RepID=UPI0018F4FAF5|nr:inositol monophosphatase family protein [Oleomonas cavernae]